VVIGLHGAGLGSIAQALTSSGRSARAVEDPSRLLDPDVRSELRRTSTVVWVDGDDDVLAADPAGDPAASIDQISKLRRQLLGPLTVTADALVRVEAADRRDAEPHDGQQVWGAAVAGRVREAADGVAARDAECIERVELAGQRGYPIVVGRGVRHSIDRYLPPEAKRVAVITQAGIGVEIDTGRDQRVFTVEDGEGAKRLEVLGGMASELAQWGMTRADCVVAVGGGVVTDLGGFLAASYHRGIAVVHVPTTLLGQIDAAIGGKCGVNLPEGKNLVGAFWQPRAVLCDVDTLDSLPEREFRAGMGELAKYHFLGGGRLDQVELVQRVARSAAIKAEVVSGDEREGGRRAILNYGHTLAHALETLSGYGTILHGEAVAVGLIYAAELAARLGRIDADRVAEHRRVVAAYGLDATIDPSLDPGAIVDLFARDKKAIDGITFVLDGPQGVEPVRVEDRRLLLDTLETVRRQPGIGATGHG
jgi:5-deoxy-5-amino-3-dehydroquinate synthase